MEGAESMAENGDALYSTSLTNIERLLHRAPYAIVTVVLRLRGRVNERSLREAVAALVLKYPRLASRLAPGEDGTLRLTTEGAGEPWIRTVPRESPDHWIRAVDESCRVPFDFEARPPVRFLLIEGQRACDVVILCHHVLCDGLSLAWVARDLAARLANPVLEMEPVPDPAPISRANVPAGTRVNGLVRMVIGNMNRRWAREGMTFVQEDYRSLHRAYWERYGHGVHPVALEEAETAALVERCRAHGVTVNSALTAAFVGAQTRVLGQREDLERVAVAVNLRERMPRPPGEGMGFYAGMARPRLRYDGRRGFWENAARYHSAIGRAMTDKALFGELALWTYLDPGLLEAIPFKRLGGLVPAGAPRAARLGAFARREDVVQRMLQRNRMDTLETRISGTAITNLGAFDWPREQGTLGLEGLILKPGGGFPLSTVNLVIGAATAAGRLNLVLEYAAGNLSASQAEEIAGAALELLEC